MTIDKEIPNVSIITTFFNNKKTVEYDIQSVWGKAMKTLNTLSWMAARVKSQ